MAYKKGMSWTESEKSELTAAGRWITDREYSALTGISRQVLANWRMEDRRRGFIAVHRPKWRLFSGAIRYWADAGLLSGQGEIEPELLGEYRPRGPRRAQPEAAGERG